MCPCRWCVVIKRSDAFRVLLMEGGGEGGREGGGRIAVGLPRVELPVGLSGHALHSMLFCVLEMVRRDSWEPATASYCDGQKWSPSCRLKQRCQLIPHNRALRLALTAVVPSRPSLLRPSCVLLRWIRKDDRRANLVRLQSVATCGPLHFTSLQSR